MNHCLIRILLVVLPVLAVLAGCDTDGGTHQARQPQAIGFGAYTVSYATRANTPLEVEKAIPDGRSIGIYAYLHDDDTWSGAAPNTPNFMYNQQAIYHDETDGFTYSPLKYWPNEEDDKVSFMAYYPYTEPGREDDTGLFPLLANDGEGLPTFRMEVRDDPERQTDLLVSDLIANLPTSRDTDGDPGIAFNDLTVSDRVKFMFHHATAKVEFCVVVDDDIVADIAHFTILPPGIRLTHVKSQGTLTPTYTPASGTTLTWTPDGTTRSYLFKTYTPQLLMPQKLSDDVHLQMDYEIAFKSDGTTYHYDGTTPVASQEYTYRNSPDMQLNAFCVTGTSTALTEWLPGHHYVYVIRLRANRIDFTAQVVDWGEYIWQTVN